MSDSDSDCNFEFEFDHNVINALYDEIKEKAQVMLKINSLPGDEGKYINYNEAKLLIPIQFNTK